MVFNATFNNISIISKNVEYLTQVKYITQWKIYFFYK